MRKSLLAAAFLSSLLVPTMADAKRINVSLTFGQDVLLASNDGVGVRAQCVLNEFGSDRVTVYATTTSNAVMRASAGYVGNGVYLTAATPPSAAVIVQTSELTGEEFVFMGFDGGYVVNIAEQQGIAVRSETAILGLNTGGEHCVVSLDIQSIKKFKAPTPE